MKILSNDCKKDAPRESKGDKNNKDQISPESTEESCEYNLLSCDTEPKLERTQEEDKNRAQIKQIIRNDSSSLQSCILLGADVNFQDAECYCKTPIHYATENNSISCLEVLLQNGALVENREKKRGDTALHLSSKHGYDQCASCLLAFGAYVDAINHDHWTPLHVAAYYGQTNCVEVLLKSDANVEAKTYEYGSTPLHLASQENNDKCVCLLLEYGADVESRTKVLSNTPLHLAAKEGHEKCVRLLLEYGADRSLKNQTGMTAIKLCDLFDHQACISLLQDHFTSEKDFREHGLPKEIRIMDARSADKLRDIMKDGWFRSYEARYMIVGEYGVGKTTLAKVLVGDKLLYIRQSTNGIELYIGKACINVEDGTWCCQDEILSSEDLAYNRLLMYTRPTETIQATYQRQLSQRTGTIRQSLKSPTTIIRTQSTPSLSPLHEEQMSSWKRDKIITPGETRPKMFTFWTSRRDVHMGDQIEIKVDKKRLLRQTVKACKRMLHKVNKAPVFIWDFGGQDVFYATHQTFLTYRGIYIIVIDGSRDLDAVTLGLESIPGCHGRLTTRRYLIFWVNSILMYSKLSAHGFPKIIVVATHCDKIPQDKRGKWKEKLFDDISCIFKDQDINKHLVLQHKFFIDARKLDDKQLHELRSALVDIAISQPFWGERMPKRFLHLEMEMLLAAENGCKIMQTSELYLINEKNPIKSLSEDDLQMFLHLQHALGKIIYFPVPKLNEHIILHPTFLIDAFRSIITDKTFCENDADRLQMWKNMNERGVISKQSINSLWSCKKYSDFEKHKDYLVELMLHLDFIAEPRVYMSGRLIPSEIYLIPCMLADTSIISWPPKDFSERAIVVSFLFQRSFLPPAIAFRFLTSCLGLWTVAYEGGQSLLSSGFLVVVIDKSHQMSVRCDESRIIISLVHTKSKLLITTGLADSLLESLNDILENICVVYNSSFDDGSKECRNTLFVVEVGCPMDSPCFLSKSALQLYKEDEPWKCPNHQIKQKLQLLLSWFSSELKETCSKQCSGIENKAFLELSAGDDHLCSLSNQFNINEVKEMLLYLGMPYQEWSEKLYANDNVEIVKLYSLLYWKDKVGQIFFKDLKKAIMEMKYDVHKLCTVTRTKQLDFDVDPLLLQKIPTDQDLDKAAPCIGLKSLHVAISLGLSLTDWENLKYANPKNLPLLNRAILDMWMTEKSKAKPTLETLAKAVLMADKCPMFLFEHE